MKIHFVLNDQVMFVSKSDDQTNISCCLVNSCCRLTKNKSTLTGYTSLACEVFLKLLKGFPHPLLYHSLKSKSAIQLLKHISQTDS